MLWRNYPHDCIVIILQVLEFHNEKIRESANTIEFHPHVLRGMDRTGVVSGSYAGNTGNPRVRIWQNIGRPTSHDVDRAR